MTTPAQVLPHRSSAVTASSDSSQTLVESLFDLPELGSAEREQLRDLSGETDTELFWAQLHHFGVELQAKGNLAAALGVFSAVRDGATEAVARTRAQASLDAVEGRGAFGARAEFLLGRLAEDASDPRTIVPMLLSSAAYELTRGMALSRFLSATNPAWWMRGFAGRLSASALAYSVEVPTFVFSGRVARGLQPRNSASPGIGNELGSAAITLGLLKISGACSQSLLNRSLGGLAAPGTRFAVGQASMFLGLLSAHQVEEKLGLRPAQEGATAFADILGSMLSLGIGAHLGRKVLGKGYAQWNQELGWRSLALDAGMSASPTDLMLSPSFASGEPPSRPDPAPGDQSRSEGGSRPPASKRRWDFKSVDSLQNVLKNLGSREEIETIVYAIDLCMAYAEALGTATPQYIQSLKDADTWSRRGRPGGAWVSQVRPRVLGAFTEYLQKLADVETFRNEAKWREVEAEFLLHCFASSIRGRHWQDQDGFNGFQQMMVFRRHHARQGNFSVTRMPHFPITDLSPAHGDLLEALAKGRFYSAYLPEGGAFDPFAPVHYPQLLKSQHEVLYPRRPIRETAQELLDLLREARRRSLLTGDVASLAAIMREPMPIQPRLQHLRSLVDQEQFMPLIPRVERRPVLWNPFASEAANDLVLHPVHGEGVLLGEAEGKVAVKFPDARLPVKLMSGAVVRPSEGERYREVLDKRFRNAENLSYLYSYLIMQKYLTGEERAALQTSIEPGYSGNFRSLLYESISSVGVRRGGGPVVRSINNGLWHLYEKIGIDPITFALKLLVGELPSDHLGSSPVSERTAEARNRNFTPDLVRESLRRKPWLKDWGPMGRPYPANVRSIGHYYPVYYPAAAERPHDLTELYFRFRDGDPGAFAETAGLFEAPVETWMAQGGNSEDARIVPMIGRAPLHQLAEAMDYPFVFPWLPRPLDYGKGVEGKRAAIKMKMVQEALKLDPSRAGELAGKRVLVLDDNGTDFITYMWARKLLLEAGASQVGLLALTHTQRDPKDLPLSLRQD